MAERSSSTLQIERVFDALGDPTRRRVVGWLSESGPATPTSLASRLPITRQAVAKHLSMLEAAGLVRCHKQGREARYKLRPEPLRQARRWMSVLESRWDERLNALDDLVSESERSTDRRSAG